MASPAKPAVKKRALRIASGCATRETFISVFRRFCDSESIFIATRTPKPRGAELNFTITLSSGQPLIAGKGVVQESFAEGASPHGRPGMRIRFVELSPSSRALVDDLVAAASAPARLRGAGQEQGAAEAGKGASAATPSRKPTLVPRPPRLPVPGKAPRAAGTPAPVLVPRPGRPVPPGPGGKQAASASRLAVAGAEQERPAPASAPDQDSSASPPAPAAPATSSPAGMPAASDDSADAVVYLVRPNQAEDDESSWDDAANEVFGETRVRGSSLVLPANPLGQMEAESLDTFVECTIYEDDVGFGEGEPTEPSLAAHEVGDDDEGAPAAAADADAAPPGPGESAATPAGPVMPPAPSMVALAPVMPPAGPATAAPPSMPPAASAMPPTAAAMPPTAPAMPPTAPVDLNSTADVLAAVRRSPWIRTAVIAAGLCLLGLVVGYLVGRGSRTRSAPTPVRAPSAVQRAARGAPTSRSATPPVRSAALATSPDNDPAGSSLAERSASHTDTTAPDAPSATDTAATDTAATDTASSTDPASSAATTEVLADATLAEGQCGVRISTLPHGTAVSVDGHDVGETPLALALPCGAQTVALHRARYRDESRTVTLAPGHLAELHVRMDRPQHRLRIGSIPRGATIRIEGRPIGTTPFVTTVRGFEGVHVSLDLAGYRHWTKRIYTRKASTNVSVRLVRQARSRRRRSSPASGRARVSPGR